ncbi:M50 family metallopeptidase [Nocardioides bruguierae]|uniref:Site-2 protease family protein n=1 Tax=Nocardioides bruguierae TaxID=2945102 RepID=A0A9X2D5K5_9ACTN|nr:site-2 protease family protein [Nocardioides bruguierae]MCL8027117.1 site-2 protease family protein [Nocardioides bruguierae]MCM0619608.1 site-2 protease family protein [Nocardioides bruguierae]
MTALLYTLGVVVFVLSILVSIGLHELGHLTPAKLFGCKVSQYFIGFGPTVWSKRIGETEYGLKAIPLGGYVKIVGMLPPGASDDLGDHLAGGESIETLPSGETAVKVRKSNTGMFTQLISDARAAEWELVQPEDVDRLFYRLPWWKKVVVMAGGPTVNVLIAFVLLLLVFSTYGQRTYEVDAGAPTVETVSACVIPYEDGSRDCTASDPASPAAEAGLLPGDTITAFNGTAITSWEQLRTLIRENSGGDAVITYERDGRTLTGETSTTVQARPTSVTDETLTQVGFLGITPTQHLVVTTGGVLFTLDQMGGMAVDVVQAMAHLPVKVWGVAKAIVGIEDRAIDSPVSIVGGGRIAGEVSSAQTIPVADRLASLVTLVALFNFFIGLFNFIPLLPLDGGHIASALWEGLRRGLARLRRRPDPGYVDAAKLLPVAYVVGSAILVMGVVLIVGDIVAPVQTSL